MRWIPASVAITAAGMLATFNIHEALAQVQGPPTNIHQSLRTDLPGMAGSRDPCSHFRVRREPRYELAHPP